ncbi:MAG: hypothetical protein M3487_05715 [Actinomycetota bacterium]|nr:hypothetical protein [Actinomycetota bacterium]
MAPYPIEALDHYWAMWNERDVDRIRVHLEQAVTDDVVFCDPLHFHVGRDALEANVRGLRLRRRAAQFAVTSRVDSHHNRHRYHWRFTLGSRVVENGFDVATVADSGLLERVDGFFGELAVATPADPSFS